MMETAACPAWMTSAMPTFNLPPQPVRQTTFHVAPCWATCTSGLGSEDRWSPDLNKGWSKTRVFLQPQFHPWNKKVKTIVTCLEHRKCRWEPRFSTLMPRNLVLWQSSGFVSAVFSLNKKVAIFHNECFIHYPVVYQASKIHIIKVY